TAFKSGSVVQLFYSLGAGLRTVRETNGTWGAPASWTNSAAAIGGLAALYAGDWNLALAGTGASGDAVLWTLIYGDGVAQAGGYGLALAYGGGDYLWAATAAGVWRAWLAAPELDLSTRVQAAEWVEEPFGGGLRLELDNADGRFAGLANGPLALYDQAQYGVH